MARKALISALTMALTALIAAALARNLSPLTHRLPLPALLGEAVHNLVLAVGILIASWYFLTAAAVLLTGMLRLLGTAPAGFERAIGRLGAPLLRQVVTWTTLSTVALGGPALATTGEDPGPAAHSPAVAGEPSEAPGSRNSAFLVDLGWVATAPPAVDRPAAPEPAPRHREEPSAAVESTARSTHVVRSGDTLWGIAAEHLRRGSEHVTPAQIAAHWPQWYAANAETIGPDPDLITPGTTLHAPTPETP